MSTMIATRQVFPIGYSTPGSQERIDELMRNPQMLLIDTRDKKDLYLKNPHGERYRYAGSHLGAEWTETGIKGLIKYLSEGHDLILLCQCSVIAEYCHLGDILCRLSDHIAIDVVREQTQARGEALPLETEQSSAEISMPSVVSVDRSIGHCVICLDAGMMVPATLASSSGREDSVYCEAHGHCKRCGESVEKFVEHPYITNYVCPCVIALLMKIERKEELKQAKPVAFSF